MCRVEGNAQLHAGPLANGSKATIAEGEMFNIRYYNTIMYLHMKKYCR